MKNTLAVILAGGGPQEDPQATFGLNVDPATFEAVSAENFIPADRSQGFFTPTLVDSFFAPLGANELTFA